MKEENLFVSRMQEKYFLNTFSLIRYIASRRLSVFCQDTIEDITQKVLLKLWSWKVRRAPGRDLSEEEWRKLANRAAQNEINSFYASQRLRDVSLTEADELIGPVLRSNTDRTESQLAGNSAVELRSLLAQMWKAIQMLSVRERYALLLKNREILNRLVAHQCCKIKEAADVLDLTKEEFIEIYRSLPMTDAQIAACLGQKLRARVTGENVIKARQRAREKVRKRLSEDAVEAVLPVHNFNERTYVARKT